MSTGKKSDVKPAERILLSCLPFNLLATSTAVYQVTGRRTKLLLTYRALSLMYLVDVGSCHVVTLLHLTDSTSYRLTTVSRHHHINTCNDLPSVITSVQSLLVFRQCLETFLILCWHCCRPTNSEICRIWVGTVVPTGQIWPMSSFNSARGSLSV